MLPNVQHPALDTCPCMTTALRSAVCYCSATSVTLDIKIDLHSAIVYVVLTLALQKLECSNDPVMAALRVVRLVHNTATHVIAGMLTAK